MVASFSVAPMGVTGGVKELIAEALKIVDESGLPYELGAMQTTVEGDPDQVMAIILRCHKRLLELAPRVLTDPYRYRRPPWRDGTAGRQGAGRRGDSGKATAPDVKSRRKMNRR